MKEIAVAHEEHHRRSLSMGGSPKDFNISWVKVDHHKHYNTLFGNSNAFQVADIINHSDFKPTDVIIVCKFINGSQINGKGKHFSKNKHKIADAWKKLSEGLTFFETIEYINDMWLDPSYHLYVESI